MSPNYLSRFSTRLVAAPSRVTIARPAISVLRSPFLFRTAATTPSPGSDSSAEAGVKSSRATDDPSTTEHGGSTSQPVSGKGDQTGQSEEGGDPQKKDPNASAKEKRESVENDMKPLDPANK